MTEWELARYLIEAKKNIDTILFIQTNQRPLVHINVHDKIAAVGQKFFINCCVVLENSFPRGKKELCKNEIIATIFYERDKNSAHKDDNYKTKRFSSPNEMAESMKKQLQEVREVCTEKLPKVVTLDYVPHDRELFRLVYRVNAQLEEDINKVKYPMATFHSYQLSEEGRFLFRHIDTTEEDRRIAKEWGYDLDELLKKQVLQSTDEIREMTEEEKQRQAIILQNGINSYEGLQNRQDACIQTNLLFHQNIWISPVWQYLEMIEEFKSIGFLDAFEIPHLERFQGDGQLEILTQIMEKYK